MILTSQNSEYNEMTANEKHHAHTPSNTEGLITDDQVALDIW